MCFQSCSELLSVTKMELTTDFVKFWWYFLRSCFKAFFAKIASERYAAYRRGFLSTSYSSVKVIVNMSMPN